MPRVERTPSERERVTKRSMSCLSRRVAVIRVSRVLSAQELQGSGYPLLSLLFCRLPVVSFWCSLSAKVSEMPLQSKLNKFSFVEIMSISLQGVC